MAVATRKRRRTGVDVPPYAAGTLAEHFAWWCREHIVQSVDRFAGEPLELEQWQLDFMAEALAVDEDMHRVWSSVALVVPRKNGKTALLAAYALYHLLEDDGQPEILLAASSDKQAGRLYDAVVSYVRRDPRLAAQVHLREYVGEIARVDGGGKILRMASDPGRAHGFNASLVIVDELHAWTTPSLRKAWAAFTTSGGARSSAQTFTITTAGEAHERVSSILGRLIDANEEHGDVERRGALAISRNEQGRTLVFNYSAQTTDPKDVAALKAANPASWITEAYLARQAANPELSDADVLQLHGCVWAVSETRWLDPGAWRILARPELVVPDGAAIGLGFDGSYSGDSTALVGCWVDGDVPHEFLIGCWERPLGASSSWRVPRGEVLAAIRAAFGRYRVLRMLADPSGWHQEIGDLRDEFGDDVVVDAPPQQRARMAAAYSNLRNAVLEGALSHDGSEVIERHIGNAHRRDTPSGVLIEKEHPESSRKIDAAVAAALAYESVVQSEGPSVYNDRDLMLVGATVSVPEGPRSWDEELDRRRRAELQDWDEE